MVIEMDIDIPLARWWPQEQLFVGSIKICASHRLPGLSSGYDGEYVLQRLSWRNGCCLREARKWILAAGTRDLGGRLAYMPPPRTGDGRVIQSPPEVQRPPDLVSGWRNA